MHIRPLDPKRYLGIVWVFTKFRPIKMEYSESARQGVSIDMLKVLVLRKNEYLTFGP